MKKLGKVTILSTNEYESLVCRCEDADAAAGDFAEELSRVRASYERDIVSAFNAGKWHSAGGYSHTLPKLKEELRRAKERVARYKPIAEIFQPSDTLIALIQEVNSVSDVDAAADFEVVKNQARLAKARS